METLEVQRVRGTNDLIPPDDARLRSIGDRLRAHFELYGYQGVDTPLIENLDLFLRKSGEEIAARMYTFTHWNRKLCLRPEFTASVMRAYVNHLQGRSLPVRLHYAGATFRYEKPQRGRYRQFTEVGLECIGGRGPAADAEVLAAACGSLRDLGLSRFRLVVGHLGVVLQLLQQLGIAEHAQALILGNMENLARRRADPGDVVERVLGLLAIGDEDPSENGEGPLPSLLAQFGTAGAADVAADLLARANLLLEGGSRSPEEIVSRLLTKAGRADPTDRVRQAIDFILRLHEVAGSPPEVFGRLDEMLRERGLDRRPLRDLERALALFERYDVGSPEVSVDLSLGRGLRYYTGMVFEIYHDAAGGAASQICGGGRYDDLIRALGGREQVPACGFSFGLERVNIALETEGGSNRSAMRETDVLVAPLASEDESDSAALAQELRAAGFRVELDVRLRGVKANLRHADRQLIPVVVLLGERERVSGCPIVRDMRSRTETSTERSSLVQWVRGLL